MASYGKQNSELIVVLYFVSSDRILDLYGLVVHILDHICKKKGRVTTYKSRIFWFFTFRGLKNSSETNPWYFRPFMAIYRGYISTISHPFYGWGAPQLQRVNMYHHLTSAKRPKAQECQQHEVCQLQTSRKTWGDPNLFPWKSKGPNPPPNATSLWSFGMSHRKVIYLDPSKTLGKQQQQKKKRREGNRKHGEISKKSCDFWVSKMDFVEWKVGSLSNWHPEIAGLSECRLNKWINIMSKK